MRNDAEGTYFIYTQISSHLVRIKIISYASIPQI